MNLQQSLVLPFLFLLTSWYYWGLNPESYETSTLPQRYSPPLTVCVFMYKHQTLITTINLCSSEEYLVLSKRKISELQFTGFLV